ncbi:MAG: macro domain-containing protein, partial [Saprospiraceae bacterium]|nr:macro domain-containing protein [Saprospiraceae bacterium]
MNEVMKKVKGDLIQLALEGRFDVIIHGCNCFCTMGAGIAKSIKLRFPEAYRADLETTKGDKAKLGQISHATINTSHGTLIVVNGYTQFNWKGRGKKVNYDAIRSVFQKVKQSYNGHKIGYPAIGAGLAGGDWDII